MRVRNGEAGRSCPTATGPLTPTAPSALNATGSSEDSSRITVARATIHAPAGRRKRWLLIVALCPLCSGCHYHLSREADTRMRRAGCGTRGRRYLVVVPTVEGAAA